MIALLQGVIYVAAFIAAAWIVERYLEANLADVFARREQAREDDRAALDGEAA